MAVVTCVKYFAMQEPKFYFWKASCGVSQTFSFSITTSALESNTLLAVTTTIAAASLTKIEYGPAAHTVCLLTTVDADGDRIHLQDHSPMPLQVSDVKSAWWEPFHVAFPC